jgi:hypothetical protein
MFFQSIRQIKYKILEQRIYRRGRNPPINTEVIGDDENKNKKENARALEVKLIEKWKWSQCTGDCSDVILALENARRVPPNESWLLIPRRRITHHTHVDACEWTKVMSCFWLLFD